MPSNPEIEQILANLLSDGYVSRIVRDNGQIAYKLTPLGVHLCAVLDSDPRCLPPLYDRDPNEEPEEDDEDSSYYGIEDPSFPFTHYKL